MLHWAVHPEFSNLVELFEGVERVVRIPRRQGLRAWRGAVAELRGESYDLVVDLQGLLKSAIVARLARSPRRIGPSFHREGSHLLYTEVAGPRNKGRHAVEECMDVLERLGLQRPGTPSFPLRLPEGPEGVRTGSPRIAIAPLSRWRTKNWPSAHFAELMRRMDAELQAELHLVGGPSDKTPADQLIAESGVSARNHCGEYTLGQSCALLKSMDLLVCNDSGPMHMAAAVGTPCVALFGPTLPDRTGPYGPGHRVLRAGNCSPCRSSRCRLHESTCLTRLVPETVFQTVRDVLDNRG